MNDSKVKINYKSAVTMCVDLGGNFKFYKKVMLYCF